MSAIDEFGLPGFLSTISNDNPDVSYLARGQDLTTLGLNLNSAEFVNTTRWINLERGLIRLHMQTSISHILWTFRRSRLETDAARLPIA